MNVTFNPSVNFKSDTNLIAEQARKMQEEKDKKMEVVIRSQLPESRYPDSWETQQDHEKRVNAELEAIKKVPYDDYKKAEPAVQEPKSNAYTAKEYTQAELDEKADIFAERLKSRKWKKEYLPENDIIMIRNKRMKDGLEYMIKNDGTVMETGLRDKAVVIIEPNRESAKTFAKYKKKLDPNAPKTSLWMKGKEAVAGVWKFFTVAGTMGVATAKGLWQGLLTGAGVLAIAAIARGTVKAVKNEAKLVDIIVSPFKAAGTSGKLLAAAAGALVLTGHLIAGKLEANQKSSVIEHKVDVPHEND